jgi:uncharacterized repeat protein (TIGR01451 family)
VKFELRVFVFAFALCTLVGLLTWSTQSIAAIRKKGSEPTGIHLVNGTIYPETGIEAGVYSAAAAQPNGRIHLLMQFDHIPDAAERVQLAAQGIDMLNYIPDNAWIVSIPATGVSRLSANSVVNWVGTWQGVTKMAPRLQTGNYPGWAVHEDGRIQIMMLLHTDVPFSEGEVAAAKHNATIVATIRMPPAYAIWIKPENITNLAAEESVLWLEEAPPPLTSTNDDARATMHVPAIHNLGLDGTGVNLFIYDGGSIAATHDAFNGRLTVIDNSSLSSHATHVAGTAAGDGSGTGVPNGRDLKGMAPEASIFSAGVQSISTPFFYSSVGDIEADYALARNTHSIDLANNSIGSNTAANGFDCTITGDYGLSSELLDNIVRGDNATVGSGVIMSWANGNERTGGSARCGSHFNSTAPPACAKNPIHVGATNSDGNSMTTFSSWGPCDDGRLKPIISGPGCESGLVNNESYIFSTLPSNIYGASGWCGTSMAAPAVAGVMTLAIEQYRITTSNPSARPTNAQMKAWLIHTAQDLGLTGPDYIYGYGEVNAEALIELIQDSGSYQTATITSNSEIDSYSYFVPTGVGQLKVSLAWDDKAAAAFTANALVNNLNLEVVDPTGFTTYYPFSLDPANPEVAATTSGENNRDNQEQVIVETPIAGNWTIRVVGASVPETVQSYALVYTHTTIAQYCGTNLITNGTFESGTSGWSIDATAPIAQVVTAPIGGSGDALQIGGDSGSSVEEYAYQQLTIPMNAEQVTLSFDWYMTSNEAEPDVPWDYFQVFVTDVSDATLKALDIRSNAWKRTEWYGNDTLDLAEFAGQTVRIYFKSRNDTSLTTTFYVDNVSIVDCEPELRFLNSSDKPIYGAGEVITFTLNTTNVSSTIANNIVFTSTVPANTTLITSSLSVDAVPTGTDAGSTITWNTGQNLTTSNGLSRTFSVTVDPAFAGELEIFSPAYVTANNKGVNNSTAEIVLSDLQRLFIPMLLKGN